MKHENTNLRAAAATAPLSDFELAKLLHELNVHQIEIEMLKGKLHMAREMAETANEKFTVHYDFAPAAYFTIGHNGTISELNLKGARMLGKDHAELVNSNFRPFITADTLPDFDTFLQNVLKSETKKTYEVRLTIQGNPSKFIHIEGVISQDKQKCLLTAIDITEHQIAAEKIQNSEKRYRRLFESAKDGILILDAHSGQIVDVNPFLIQLLGYSFDELIGKELWEIGIFMNIATSKEAFLELQNKKYIRFDDMPLETKSGKSVNVEFVSNVYLENKTNVVQCNIRDITQRKRVEKELVKAKEKAEENDKLKTAFLRNVFHEIRTPMNAIVGFSDLINDPCLSPEKRDDFIEVIVQSSRKLLAVINDIVDIATIETGQERVYEKIISLNTICKLIHEKFATKALIQNIMFNYTTTMTDTNATIMSDESKLIQILTNLIENAIKFTPKGFVKFGYTVKDNFVEFYVEDSGIGIDPAMHHEIFERFRQVEIEASRQFGGAGLGLSIAKAYIELLGGKIWVNSELGKGSSFHFTIPYKNILAGDLYNQQVLKGLKVDSKKQKTILIVEDEISNYLLLEAYLSDSNLNILKAENGVEAVTACLSNPEIDLVLMDIKLPEMNGYEATKQIKRFRPSLPVIAQTAYASETDKNKAYASGCTDFISKPFNQDVLMSKIREQLNREHN
jgi:PAS domain S-box-containing protein